MFNLPEESSLSITILQEKTLLVGGMVFTMTLATIVIQELIRRASTGRRLFGVHQEHHFVLLGAMMMALLGIGRAWKKEMVIV
jgi:hypothetical protein